MPKLTIEGKGTYEIAAGTRLVNALREHVDIGHRCGGQGRCTTCRVEFLSGEPESMTIAEAAKLSSNGGLGTVRLSCQILVEADQHVRPLVLVSEQPWPDAGSEPAATIEPEPEWTTREAAAKTDFSES